MRAFDGVLAECRLIVAKSQERVEALGTARLPKQLRKVDVFVEFKYNTKKAVVENETYNPEEVNKKICESYLESKFHDDIVTFVRKFSNLSMKEIDEYAWVIQRAFKWYKARKELARTKRRFKAFHQKNMQEIK